MKVLIFLNNYVRENLELRLNEIGKNYGVVLHDYTWLIINHMNSQISAEEKLKTLENFCIFLPYDNDGFEREKERGEYPYCIWTFRSDPNMILEGKIRFGLYNPKLDKFKLGEDEFIIVCHGKNYGNEESEKLSEDYLKSFFAKTCDVNVQDQAS